MVDLSSAKQPDDLLAEELPGIGDLSSPGEAGHALEAQTHATDSARTVLGNIGAVFSTPMREWQPRYQFLVLVLAVAAIVAAHATMYMFLHYQDHECAVRHRCDLDWKHL
jgi:hypothetical protein